MNLKCYVIDDELHAIDVVVRYINRTPGLELLGTDKNPLHVIKKMGDGELQPDLIFADIEMPEMSGIEFAEIVGNRSLIIFTTAFAKFAVSAFDKSALDYMLKPITYERFLKAVDKARQKLADRNAKSVAVEADYFYIKADLKGKLIKVHHGDVVYIEAKQNYVHIVQDAVSHLTYLTLSEIEEQLPQNFMRCHKSFIANLAKVSIVEAGMITFKDGKQILLGTAYKEKFMEGIEQKVIRSKRR